MVKYESFIDINKVVKDASESIDNIINDVVNSFESQKQLIDDVEGQISECFAETELLDDIINAAAQMAEAIIKDQRRVFPVCVQLQGEYGIDNCYLGVPVILGKNGIEKIIELQLNDEEKALLTSSEGHVREVMAVLDRLNG